MIENVRLINFISHKQTEIELDDGINVFVGNNGSGKSSVIDAILFALYGKHTRGTTNKVLVKRGESESAVSVTFTSRNKRYVAERRIDSRGRLVSSVLKEILDTERRQIISGERRQMEESMSGFVQRILGLDYEMMKIATIVPQGELDSIVTEYRPSDFKNLIDKVIGIERLERAYSCMLDVINELNRRLRLECKNYDVDSTEKVREEINERSKKEREESEELERVSSILAQETKKEAELSSIVSELERKKSALEFALRQRESLNSYIESRKRELESEVTRLEEEVSKARSYLSLLERKHLIAQEARKLESELELLGKENERLIQEIALIRSINLPKIESELQKIEREISDANSRLSDLNKKKQSLLEYEKVENKEQLEKKLEEVDNKIHALVGQLGKTEQKLADYMMLRDTGVCPVCDTLLVPKDIEQKIYTKEEEKRNIEAELSSLKVEKEDIAKLIEKAKSYDNALKMLAEIQGEVSRINERIAFLEGEREAKKKEIEEAKKRTQELTKLETERERISGEINKLRNNQREISKLEAEVRNAENWLNEKGIKDESDVSAIEARKEESKKVLSQIPENASSASLELLAIDDYSRKLVSSITDFLERSRGFSEKEYSEKSKELEATRNEVKRLSGIEGAKKEALRKLRDEIVELTRIIEELEVAKKYIDAYRKIRDSIFRRDGVLATSLRSWALLQVSRYSSEYIRRFGIDVSQITLSEEERKVEITCYGSRGILSVDSMSGGEKVAVSLAIRLALANIAGKGSIDFVFLDEPTVHLDTERRKSLVRLISNLGAGEGASLLKQIVIITHDQDIFEDFEVGSIFKFENISGTSSVTRL